MVSSSAIVASGLSSAYVERKWVLDRIASYVRYGIAKRFSDLAVRIF